MREPERQLEPPEPEIITSCCVCGEVICEGDYYFEIDGDNYCEECGKNWLDQHGHYASKEE